MSQNDTVIVPSWMKPELERKLRKVSDSLVSVTRIVSMSKSTYHANAETKDEARQIMQMAERLKKKLTKFDNGLNHLIKKEICQDDAIKSLLLVGISGPNHEFIGDALVGTDINRIKRSLTGLARYMDALVIGTDNPPPSNNKYYNKVGLELTIEALVAEKILVSKANSRYYSEAIEFVFCNAGFVSPPNEKLINEVKREYRK